MQATDCPNSLPLRPLTFNSRSNFGLPRGFRKKVSFQKPPLVLATGDIALSIQNGPVLRDPGRPIGLKGSLEVASPPPRLSPRRCHQQSPLNRPASSVWTWLPDKQHRLEPTAVSPTRAGCG